MSPTDSETSGLKVATKRCRSFLWRGFSACWFVCLPAPVLSRIAGRGVVEDSEESSQEGFLTERVGGAFVGSIGLDTTVKPGLGVVSKWVDDERASPDIDRILLCK